MMPPLERFGAAEAIVHDATRHSYAW